MELSTELSIQILQGQRGGEGGFELDSQLFGKTSNKMLDLYLLSSQGVFMEGLGVVGDTRQWGGKQSPLNIVLQ